MDQSRLDSYLLDPYALVFERVLRFYENTKDTEGLDLIKECIYLRITGYPTPCQPDEENPKKVLLRRYLREWSWDEVQIKRLSSYPSWTEGEKLEFEDGLTKKLWFLYTLLLRADDTPLTADGRCSEDLDALRRKASVRLKKKNGKLPWASNYLRSQGGTCPIFVAYRQGHWVVYRVSVKGSYEKESALFSAPELLRVLGWIVCNGLYQEDPKTVSLQRVQSPVLPRRVRQLLEAVYEHFSSKVDPAYFRDPEPRWHKMFVLLDTSRFAEAKTLPAADFLVQNTWGEFFCHTIDLRPIENRLLKYHEIGKTIWRHLQENDLEGFYRLYDLRTVEDLTAEKKISESVKTLQRDRARLDRGSEKIPFGRSGGEGISKNGLILDLM